MNGNSRQDTQQSGVGSNGTSERGRSSEDFGQTLSLNQSSEGRASFSEDIQKQLREFGSIARLAQENAQIISDNQGAFVEFKDATQEDIKQIRARLDALEKGGVPLASKEKNTKGSNEKGSVEKSGKGNGEFSYNIPNTKAEILALQRILADKGYDPGPVDGLMGRRTRLAVKRMQQEHGLPITGWLSAESMMVVEAGPKQYSGKPLSEADAKMNARAQNATKRPARAPKPKESVKRASDIWFVRGMTTQKAVVYRMNGMSYAVSKGSEIPGMGQVLDIDPQKHTITTARGTINRR
jgi:lysozyme family protein